MPNEMTKDDAARVQSTQAIGGKNMSSDSFAARAQSAGDKNDNVSTNNGSNTSDQSGSVQEQGGQKK